MKKIYSDKIVNLKEMVNKAKAGRYAVGHFNINNLEWTKAILEAAEETKTPVIIGVSEGAIKYMGGYNTVSRMVSGLIEDLKTSVPVALHLDHGQSVESVKKAILAGFSSVMFDGSHLSFEENLSKTKEVVEIASEYNISVEAEIGSIGGEEDGVVGSGELGNPEEAKKIAALGIDILAAGFGNIHGTYPKEWKGLSFSTLSEIEKAGKKPMVLHGGSGIPQEQVEKAIKLGISKINVNTECQLSFQKATRKYFEDKKDLEPKGFDPRKIMKPGYEAIKKTFKDLSMWFGSQGKA